MNGELELLHAVRFTAQQTDCQRTYGFREFFLQHRQGRVFHRRHQHPLAIGQVMADDVGDGMGLARTGRALHHNAIVHLQQLDDLHLLIVVRFGEIQLLRFCRRRIIPLGTADVGQTTKRWQDHIFQHTGRFGENGPQGRRQLTGLLDPGFKATQVFNKHIAVAGAGKQAPGIGDTQELGSLGDGSITLGQRHRQKLTMGIEQGRC